MSGGPSPRSPDAAGSRHLTLTLALNATYLLVLALLLTLGYLLLFPGEEPPAPLAEDKTSREKSPLAGNSDQPAPPPAPLAPVPPAPPPFNSEIPEIPSIATDSHPGDRYISPHRIVKPGDSFGKDLEPGANSDAEWNTNVVIRTKIIDLTSVIDVPSDTVVALNPADLQSLSQFKGTDLLTAPTVVTRPGQVAKIEIVSDVPHLEPTTGEVETLPLGITIDLVATPPPNLDPAASLSEVSREPVTVQAVLTINEFAGFVDADPAAGHGGIPTAHQVQLDTVLTLEPGADYRSVAAFVREDISVTEDVVPVLGELPFIGPFFRSSFETTEQKQSFLLISFDWIDETGKTASAATN